MTCFNLSAVCACDIKTLSEISYLLSFSLPYSWGSLFFAIFPYIFYAFVLTGNDILFRMTVLSECDCH